MTTDLKEDSDSNHMCQWVTKQKIKHRESCFFVEIASESDLGSFKEVAIFLGILIDMQGNVLRILRCARGKRI